MFSDGEAGLLAGDLNFLLDGDPSAEQEIIEILQVPLSEQVL